MEDRKSQGDVKSMEMVWDPGVADGKTPKKIGRYDLVFP
jgi:hypothetical protein